MYLLSGTHHDLQELPFNLPWLAQVNEHGNTTVAAFLIARGPYSYISSGSYTGTNFWHTPPGKYAFGSPVAGPTRTVSANGSSIVYRRQYQRANITLTCPAPKSPSSSSLSFSSPPVLASLSLSTSTAAHSKCTHLIEEY
jgi:hypothetical protein